MATAVLVVDDDPAIRRLVEYVLAGSGFVVRVAADGQEALEALRREPPDLVVSDVAMPRLDGVELIRRLRAQGDTTPVLLCSAAERVDVPAGVPFIAKPFALDRLLDAVHAALPAAR